jgi:WD40 repeat protein
MANINVLKDTRDTQTTVKCLGTFVGHLSDITCLVCYGEILISGSMDNTIKVWDTTSKYTCIKTHEAHIGGIRRMLLKNNILYTTGDKDRKLMVMKSL